MPAKFETKATRTALEQIEAAVDIATRSIVKKGAHLIQARAASKLHVGYGVRTGTMRRSGRVRMAFSTEHHAEAEVGPTVIYARRFELGFVGPDSLGRVFPYRPRPYWKPATEEAKPFIQKIAQKMWADAIREAMPD